MDDFILSENTISQRNASEEKSKKRAEELKASVAAPRKSKSAEKKDRDLSSQEQEALESSIVDELNRTLAIVHTSSTYILIEKGDVEFVLDSKNFSLDPL